ncbi:type-F conjugative transfer system secretin TraK, partial [Deferribacterales bacterium Es71-Z0220]|uniref:TraK domain-containing protein n=1 Tax=Deferrivibrio essentukiensis TaxID=2880922 RepID=UPI001F60EA95
KMKKLLIFTALIISVTSTIYASVIKKDFRELVGNKFINASIKDVNLLRFPYQIKEVQSSKDLSMNIRGKNVFIKLIEKVPTELFIMLNDPDETTINIILNPKDIPSQTIEFTDKTAEMKKVYEEEKSIPYEKAIRNIIVSISKTGKVKGYSVLEADNETIKTNELELTKLRTYQGYKYSAEVWKVKNISDKALYLEEPFFYMIGMKAISIENHNLAKGEETLLYIVR